MGIGLHRRRPGQAGGRALKSPLIDTEIVGARGILLSIAGGEDLTLLEVNDAAETVRQAATDDTNIIFGATVDERLAGQVWVTVVATASAAPPPDDADLHGRHEPASHGRPARTAELPPKLDERTSTVAPNAARARSSRSSPRPRYASGGRRHGCRGSRGCWRSRARASSASRRHRARSRRDGDVRADAVRREREGDGCAGDADVPRRQRQDAREVERGMISTAAASGWSTPKAAAIPVAAVTQAIESPTCSLRSGRPPAGSGRARERRRAHARTSFPAASRARATRWAAAAPREGAPRSASAAHRSPTPMRARRRARSRARRSASRRSRPPSRAGLRCGGRARRARSERPSRSGPARARSRSSRCSSARMHRPRDRAAAAVSADCQPHAEVTIDAANAAAASQSQPADASESPGPSATRSPSSCGVSASAISAATDPEHGEVPFPQSRSRCI